MLEGNQNRKYREFLRFFGASAFSLIFAKWTHKTLFILKYKPNAFQSNIRIPIKEYNFLGSHAVMISTGLSTGIFSMVLFGTCWITDIDSVEEFTEGFRKLLRPLNTRNSSNNYLDTTSLSSIDNQESLKEIWDSLKK